MQPCANTHRGLRLAAVLAVLFLAGCGAVRRDDGGQPPLTGTTTPGSGSTASPAPGTPGKPAAPTAPPDKGDPDQRFNQALELLRGNQVAEAEAAFQSLTADFPQFSGAWTDLGIIYAKSNRRDAALAALSRAVSLNKRNAVAHNWLGILYREAREYSRAERAYKTALEAQPGYALAHLNLGILYDEHLKRPQDALPHYKAYQQAGGKDDLRVLAWIAEIEAPQKAAAAKAQPASAPSAPAAPASPVVEPRR